MLQPKTVDLHHIALRIAYLEEVLHRIQACLASIRTERNPMPDSSGKYNPDAIGKLNDRIGRLEISLDANAMRDREIQDMIENLYRIVRRMSALVIALLVVLAGMTIGWLWWYSVSTV